MYITKNRKITNCELKNCLNYLGKITRKLYGLI